MQVGLERDSVVESPHEKQWDTQSIFSIQCCGSLIFIHLVKRLKICPLEIDPGTLNSGHQALLGVRLYSGKSDLKYSLKLNRVIYIIFPLDCSHVYRLEILFQRKKTNSRENTYGHWHLRDPRKLTKQISYIKAYQLRAHYHPHTKRDSSLLCSTLVLEYTSRAQ